MNRSNLGWLLVGALLMAISGLGVHIFEHQRVENELQLLIEHVEKLSDTNTKASEAIVHTMENQEHALDLLITMSGIIRDRDSLAAYNRSHPVPKWGCPVKK